MLPLLSVPQPAQTDCSNPASAICCSYSKGTWLLQSTTVADATCESTVPCMNLQQMNGRPSCTASLLVSFISWECVWQPQVCLTVLICRCKVTKVAGCTCCKSLSGPCRLVLDTLYTLVGQPNSSV